ncbi:radical SAM/SPASM domain-containing protein [Streptacidiphilus rugosus]|uniref:radical SAM/SPASM domain-containing protein n=1 Tax=Streptacidiphilus rugosus TaxID=405783 RepID=UPI00056C98B5|nr:radical SAM/SPASM domain-containing protein [Streptacidiphilus rugosus]
MTLSPAPAAGDLVRSRYLLLGEHPYRDVGGGEVWFGYATRSASLVRLDPRSAAALRSGDLAGLDRAELARLAGLRAVVDRTEDELGSVTGGLRTTSDDRRARSVTVMPTSYCNMACSYCGQEHFKAAHDQVRADRTARRVEALFEDPGTSRVTVTWFGGEPLLALRVIREMSARFTAAAARTGKPYGARMATNGSLLTVRTLEELHREWALNAVELTLDGPQRTHDRRRLRRNGAGSFDRTVAVLAEVLRGGRAPGLRLGIRVNIDQDNEDQVTDLMNDLAALGLNHPQVTLHLTPVHSWGNDVSAVEVAARDYAAREAEWLRLAEALGLGFAPLPTSPVATTCVATTRSGEIIDPQGRIYSCSEHPLVPGARDSGVVARVEELSASAVRPAGAFDDWYEQVGAGDAQCSRCPILPVCGGSCPKLWREGHLPCPSVRFNWAARMDLAARRLGCTPVEAAAGTPVVRG